MSTVQSISSTYAGQDAGIYISAAIKTADTIEKGVVEVLPNVKYQTAIHKLAYADGTTDFACDFTPAGSVTLSDKTLTPKKLMVNLELCKENFVDTWEAESMGFGAANENLPTNFQDYFIAKVLEKQAYKIDSDIWNGTTGSGDFTGFLTKWDSDGSIVKIPNPVALSGSNVVAALEKVYDAIPDAIMNKPDLKFVVSTNVAKAYRRALSTSGFRNDFSVGDKPLDFEGMELTTISSLPANTIAVFQKSNLYFGTGLLSDHNEVKILDMADKDLSDNVRFKMVYTGGVEYVVSEEIVLYAL